MEIIDNLTSNQNHKEYILKMIQQSDELFITSPFLMRDFSLFFKQDILTNIRKITLITTLVPNSLDQLKKVYSLKSLIEIPQIKSGEIECNISLNNKLHGKIYIFKNSGINIGGLVTSANFTDSGLHLNHEWRITIDSQESLNKLEESIINSIETEFKYLSHQSIIELLDHLNSFLTENGTNHDEEIDLDLTKFLDTKKQEKKKSEPSISSSSHETYEFKITEQYLEGWQGYFDEFVQFKLKNNEVTVSPDYINYSHHYWYKKQKIFYANGTIPEEHKKKLIEVGFYFGDGHEIKWAKIWEENYGLLSAYHEEYGDSNVPHTRIKDDSFYSLGNWVAIQKTYRNNGVLSEYKIERLNELDFIWSKDLELNKGKWMDKFEELKEWTKIHGNPHVNQSNPDGTQNKLGRWLNDQRHLKRRGKKRKDGTLRFLEQEREELLLEIGVDFDHQINKHIDSFEKQVQSFLSFRYQYPNLKPPTGTFKSEKENLAQWKHKIDKLPLWKKNRLINEKIL